MDSLQSNQVYENQPPAFDTTVKKLRRGDKREDGKVFWQYDRSRKGGQRWVSLTSYEKRIGEEKTSKRKSYEKHREKRLRKLKQWREENKQKCKESLKKWYVANKARHRQKTKEWFQKNRERASQYSKNWKVRNKEKVTLRVNRYQRERRKADPIFMISTRLRARIRRILSRRRFIKSENTEGILGCDSVNLVLHIEKQFLEGMNWSNREKWHLDHIVPCEIGRTYQDLLALSHYTNLRPMWAKDNILKSDRLPDSSELPLDLHSRVRELYEIAVTKYQPTTKE